VDGGGTREAAPGAAVSADTLYEVVRDVVAEVAPRELPLVRSLKRLSRSARARAPRRRARRDPLGFGLDDTVVLVWPVAWIAVQQLTVRLTDRALDGASGRLRAAFRMRRARRRVGAETAVPRLTDDQVAEVHRRVVETGLAGGLDQAVAGLLADAVVGRLRRTARPQLPGGDTAAAATDAADAGRAP
jgi:hypothetical protein